MKSKPKGQKCRAKTRQRSERVEEFCGKPARFQAEDSTPLCKRHAEAHEGSGGTVFPIDRGEK